MLGTDLVFENNTEVVGMKDSWSFLITAFAGVLFTFLGFSLMADKTPSTVNSTQAEVVRSSDSSPPTTRHVSANRSFKTVFEKTTNAIATPIPAAMTLKFVVRTSPRAIKQNRSATSVATSIQSFEVLDLKTTENFGVYSPFT